MKIEGGCYCGEVRYSFEGETGPCDAMSLSGVPIHHRRQSQCLCHDSGGRSCIYGRRPEFIPAHRYRQCGDTTLLPELRHVRWVQQHPARPAYS